ncbi:hypothetical protein BJX68DRAFT_270525 [Aspergillus pseudodeflectus]|uniref:Uncharacterized protein n=1 Tax=Aspergillus pseudodeflectus TaxID=176178 RepID=A0ABR4JRC3_9EURO
MLPPIKYHRIPSVSPSDSNAVTGAKILIFVIHGRTRNVPRKISFGILSHLSILVDYYGCHEVLELFSDIWIQDLKGTFDVKRRSYRMNCLLIAWVFNQEEIFSEVTAFIPLTSTDTIDSYTINQGRYKYIEKVLDILHDFYQGLIDGNVKCLQVGNEEWDYCVMCCYQILGALVTLMKHMGLPSPRPLRPYPGIRSGGLKYDCFKKMQSNLKLTDAINLYCGLAKRLDGILNNVPFPPKLKFRSIALPRS